MYDFVKNRTFDKSGCAIDISKVVGIIFPLPF